MNKRDSLPDERFEFGDNWRSFLKNLDDSRIDQAIESMVQLLQLSKSELPLKDATFLDIGSGSGLFSLAAFRLGATVVSMDFDPASVACTQKLKARYAENDDRWTVHRGSVLDEAHMQSLGTFDIVYSWGVLHHTGEMARAIQIAMQNVAKDGTLAIAIYNDQGGASRRWRSIKKLYNRLPKFLRPVWVLIVAGLYEFKFAVARLVRGKNPLPFQEWRQKKSDRGMSAWHDWVDWIGGLPFEYARPEEIVNPLIQDGYQLRYLRTVGSGWGCNEFVFQKNTEYD